MLPQIIITLLIFGVHVVENAAPRHREAAEKVESLNQTHASAARSCTFRPELRIDCYPEMGSNQGARPRLILESHGTLKCKFQFYFRVLYCTVHLH